MEYILGIITGILLATVSIIGTYTLSRNKSLRVRYKQVEAILKKKGEVFEPDNEELESWVNNLPKE
jgi:hypothetical protein